MRERGKEKVDERLLIIEGGYMQRLKEDKK